MLTPEITNSFLAFLTALLITYFCIPPLIYFAISKKILDEPNYRKVHKEKIPNLGGAAILAGLVISFSLWVNTSFFSEFQFILISLLLLFIVGLKDDVIGISPLKKFIIQIIASFIVVYFGQIRIFHFYGIFGIEELSGSASIIFSMFVIIGITNAYNLIDGIDGLSAGLGCIACFVFGSWLFYNGEQVYSILAFTLAGTLLAFLRYNIFPKAKIFLGDQGALVLGFLISLIAIKFIEINASRFLNPVYSAPAIAIGILIIPIVDTTRVCIIRVLNKKSPFIADRSHIHHDLVNMGLSQGQTCLILFSINVIVIFEVILFRSLNTIPLLMIITLTTLIFIVVLEILTSRILGQKKFKITSPFLSAS